MKNKRAMQIARDVETVRRLLKQFLYALCVSEGFGEKRLMRVLVTWTEIHDKVETDQNNEMMLIDNVLDRVIPSRYVEAIGYEPLKDRKGRIIK